MILAMKDVEKIYGEQKVLQDLNFEIATGEIFVLVGPSGSGKTTTLKMINGLIQPSSGEIYFKEKNLSSYNLQKVRWQMGYVLQEIALFPTMTVQENIEVIPEMLGWSKEKRHKTTRHLLADVGLDPDVYAQRMPEELSGGEQQRIGILRAIASEPDIILMDEPFSALDPISRTSLQDLVLSLHEKLQTTIVFVTHNMQEALRLGTRIAVMHEGKIVQCDRPEKIINEPATEFVQQFFKDTADEKHFLKQTLAEHLHHFNLAKENKEAPKVSVDTSIKEILQVFSTTEGVNLTQGQRVLGYLTIQEFLKKISQEEV